MMQQFFFCLSRAAKGRETRFVIKHSGRLTFFYRKQEVITFLSHEIMSLKRSTNYSLFYDISLFSL